MCTRSVAKQSCSFLILFDRIQQPYLVASIILFYRFQTVQLQQQEESRTTIHYKKDTIVNCLVILFERVPEVTIDQNQGYMIIADR
jgi:hypothetical protein